MNHKKAEAGQEHELQEVLPESPGAQEVLESRFLCDARRAGSESYPAVAAVKTRLIFATPGAGSAVEHRIR